MFLLHAGMSRVLRKLWTYGVQTIGDYFARLRLVELHPYLNMNNEYVSQVEQCLN